jgi:hypothetical protein
MKKVKLVQYNWHQVGSTSDIDGAGENYEKVELGKNGVLSITEENHIYGVDCLNYLIEKEDGFSFRILNPNLVEYFPQTLKTVK